MKANLNDTTSNDIMSILILFTFALILIMLSLSVLALAYVSILIMIFCYFDDFNFNDCMLDEILL